MHLFSFFSQGLHLRAKFILYFSPIHFIYIFFSSFIFFFLFLFGRIDSLDETSLYQNYHLVYQHLLLPFGHNALHSWIDWYATPISFSVNDTSYSVINTSFLIMHLILLSLLRHSSYQYPSWLLYCISPSISVHRLSFLIYTLSLSMHNFKEILLSRFEQCYLNYRVVFYIIQFTRLHLLRH